MTAPRTSTFPTSLDSPLMAPTAADTLATPDVEHDNFHAYVNDVIRKIELELGINGSPDTGSINYQMAHHTHTGLDGSAIMPSVLAKMTVGQGVNPVEVQDSTGAVLWNVGTDGFPRSSKYLDRLGTHYVDMSLGSAALVTNAGSAGGWQAYSGDPGITPLFVNSISGATANLFAAQVSGANKFTVDPSGNVVAQGTATANRGLDLRSGPTGGYSGQIRFGGGDTTSLAGGAGFGFTDNYTGSPRMYYDHSGTGNTGDWIWRNGTGAANTMMLLTGAGNLQLNSAGGILDVSASTATAVAGGSGIGDKIALFAASYGFGVQAGALVAYTSGSFAVRAPSATGQKSSGTNAVILGSDGTINATGAITGVGLRTGGDPGAGSVSQVTFTSSSGVGNGAVANLTALAKGTGSGPASLQVYNWIKTYFGTTTAWIPVCV